MLNETLNFKRWTIEQESKTAFIAYRDDAMLASGKYLVSDTYDAICKLITKAITEKGSARAGRGHKTFCGIASSKQCLLSYTAQKKAFGDLICIDCNTVVNIADNFSLEHTTPVEYFDRNGIARDNTAANLTYSHKLCNSRKGCKMPDDYYNAEQTARLNTYREALQTVTEQECEANEKELATYNRRFAKRHKGGKWLRHTWKA